MAKQKTKTTNINVNVNSQNNNTTTSSVPTPHMATFYVSNPTAKIEIGVMAENSDSAREVAEIFGNYMEYPIKEIRIDPFFIIDRKSVEPFIPTEDSESLKPTANEQ